MALITTIGGSASTSYASLNDAQDFFADTEWAADWNGIGDDGAKEARLLEGVEDIHNYRFPGIRSCADQALEWPRVLVSGQADTVASLVATNWMDLKGRVVSSGAVPTQI